MKTIKLDIEIDGIPGSLELREPSVSAIRPHMDLMQSNTSDFMLEVLAISLYEDGILVPNVLDKIGLSEMTELMPMITELLGFGGDDEENG